MSVDIKYLGHSAFLISDGAASVLIDPFIMGVSGASVSIIDLKVQDILVTHGHGDHLGESIVISKAHDATITAVFELANYCSSKGAKSQGVNIGGRIAFPWGNATWLPAQHSSSTPDGGYGGVAASILISIGGILIYHAGDTGLHMDMMMIGEIYKPDVALLPIGGHYTMGIDEAVLAARWIGSKIVIPMHYNTFSQIQADPLEFKKEIESEEGFRCVVLTSGEVYSISS